VPDPAACVEGWSVSLQQLKRAAADAALFLTPYDSEAAQH
jgi:hypothetical protein